MVSWGAGVLGAGQFERVTAQIDDFSWRSEISVEFIGSPQKIAPFSYALEAEVDVRDGEPGTGRLILLHDPSGNDAWDGYYRFVTLARAQVDQEMVNDPLLAGVAWSWLSGALEVNQAAHTAAAGTVTAVASASFGDLASEPAQAEVEIRASWTPLLDHRADVVPHLRAWQELLGHVNGLAPIPEGITMLGSRLNKGLR